MESKEERWEHIRNQPCVINDECCSTGGVDVHHITTRGAGGNDDWDNIAPLCRIHHVEIHQIGRLTFIVRYPQWRNFLKKLNRTDILDKLKRSKFR